jgi:hypothetical protein
MLHTLYSWAYETQLSLLIYKTGLHMMSYFLQEVMGRTNRLLSLKWHGPNRKLCVQQFFYCYVCTSCRGKVFIETLSGNYKRYTHRNTDHWEGFMKYAVEMGSGAVIYIPSVTKIDSAIIKLMWRGGEFTNTQTRCRYHTRKLTFTYSE